MSCLTLKVTYLSKPLEVATTLATNPLTVTASSATEPMLVSVGLVCSVGGLIELLSSDEFSLYSSDGYVLFGKQ